MFGDKKKQAINTLVNQDIDEFVMAEPAFRYTQVILAEACERAGKRLYIFTAALDWSDNQKLAAKYKTTKVKDDFTSLASAITAAKNYVESNPDKNILLWSDQHIPIMSTMMKLPRNVTRCWLPYHTGTNLTALLAANPDVTFVVVCIHKLIEPDPTKYPNDYTRVKFYANHGYPRKNVSSDLAIKAKKYGNPGDFIYGVY